MSKYRVLEECAAILDALGPDDNSAEKEQALREETRAIAEAALALRRLASEDVRSKLDRFVEEGVDGGVKGHDASDRMPRDDCAPVGIRAGKDTDAAAGDGVTFSGAATGTVASGQQGSSATRSETPGREAKRHLTDFAAEAMGDKLVLQMRHKEHMLNSFDADFWAKCFVDLFFRGDCRE
eukprot:6530887-Karenia_brevis.AAC.1